MPGYGVDGVEGGVSFSLGRWGFFFHGFAFNHGDFGQEVALTSLTTGMQDLTTTHDETDLICATHETTNLVNHHKPPKSRAFDSFFFSE